MAPGHQGSHLKCMLFSSGYLACEFPVCVLHRLSAGVFVPGAGFWTGWTCLLYEVCIKFNLCVILAHNDNLWLYLSIYQVINILGYVFGNFRSWVLLFLDLKFVLVCRYPGDMSFRIKSFLGLFLVAFMYDLFPCVDLDEFTAVLDQFDITSVGPSYMLDLHWNTVTTSMVIYLGSSPCLFMSLDWLGTKGIVVFRNWDLRTGKKNGHR